MITNFEEITKELIDEEKKLVRVLYEGFSTKTKERPVKSHVIIKSINSKKQEFGLTKNFTGVRLRKLVNFMRSAGIQAIIATSKGYYVSQDKEEISRCVQSLRERAAGINCAADGLSTWL